jgi:hypothetical protein
MDAVGSKSRWGPWVAVNHGFAGFVDGCAISCVWFLSWWGHGWECSIGVWGPWMDVVHECMWSMGGCGTWEGVIHRPLGGGHNIFLYLHQVFIEGLLVTLQIYNCTFRRNES